MTLGACSRTLRAPNRYLEHGCIRLLERGFAFAIHALALFPNVNRCQPASLCAASRSCYHGALSHQASAASIQSRPHGAGLLGLALAHVLLGYLGRTRSIGEQGVKDELPLTDLNEVVVFQQDLAIHSFAVHRRVRGLAHSVDPYLRPSLVREIANALLLRRASERGAYTMRMCPCDPRPHALVRYCWTVPYKTASAGHAGRTAARKAKPNAGPGPAFAAGGR